MDPRRLGATGTIAATGLGLAAGAVVTGLELGVDGPTLALVLTGLGVVLGLVLTAGAAVLYRSDVRTDHAIRIAGWNLLGVVVIGAVLAVAATVPEVALPGYVVVDVLGVSSVAHVLIGFNDVRRIRAEELARQRRKLSVVNRVVRHNLRNDVQVLSAFAGELRDSVDTESERAAAEAIYERAIGLADTHENLSAFQRAVDDDPPAGTVVLEPLVEDLLAAYRERHPDGTFEASVPEGLVVRADDQLELVLEHLLDNAVEHGSPDEPWARLEATVEGDSATVTVRDRGPGIPERERELLTGDREITQLEHGSGLGLWVAVAIAERYGGDFEARNDDGAVVSITLEAA